MKKASILGLSLSFILGLIGCDKVEPKAPEAQAYRTPPADVLSSIDLPIDIPKAKLKEILESTLPLQFTGKQDLNIPISLPFGITKNLAGVMELSATREAIPFGFRLDTLTAQTRIKGMVKIRFPGLPETQFNWDGLVGIASKITLDPNWNISSGSQIKFVTEKAAVPIRNTFFGQEVGFDIPLGTIVQLAVQSKLNAASKLIDQKLKEVSLKPFIAPHWQEVLTPRQLSKEPPVWLALNPQKLRFGGFSEFNDIIRFRIGVDAFVKAQLGESAPVMSNLSKDLPPLDLKKSAAQMVVNLPISIDYKSATDLARKVLAGKAQPVGEGREVFVNDILVAGNGPKLNIKVDFKVNSPSVEGFFYLLGEPYYDKATQEVRLKNVDFDIESWNVLAKAVKWMKHDDIVKILTDKVRFPAGAQIATQKAMINDKLKSLDIAGKAKLEATLDSVSVEDLYLDAIGIQAVARARGVSKLTVTQLSVPK